jgi:3'-5' exonuclease
MATLVFDIETVGEPWDELDAVTQSTLTRWAKRSSKTEAEYAAAVRDVQEGLGFSPLTGYIVAIGVYDVERAQGAVYYQGDGATADETLDEFVYKERTESTMLVDFWAGASAYDTFVSFNGRAFDVPWLLHRSAILGVTPSCQLLRRRYLSQQSAPWHVDLQDELTWYGTMNRRPSLHLFCRAYGITSPKTEVGGDDVAELFHKKKFRDIANYNAADVRATAQLYERWQNYLAPAEWLTRDI